MAPERGSLEPTKRTIPKKRKVKLPLRARALPPVPRKKRKTAMDSKDDEETVAQKPIATHQETQENDAAFTTKLTINTKSVSPKQFPILAQLEWKRAGRGRQAANHQALEEYIRSAGIESRLPVEHQVLAVDHPIPSLMDLRDMLRRVYKCEELGLQLRYARLIIPTIDYDLSELYHPRVMAPPALGTGVVTTTEFDLMACDWQFAKEELEMYSQRLGLIGDVSIWVVLRPLDTENEKDLYDSCDLRLRL